MLFKEMKNIPSTHKVEREIMIALSELDLIEQSYESVTTDYLLSKILIKKEQIKYLKNLLNIKKKFKV
jgi:hypothetical protein